MKYLAFGLCAFAVACKGAVPSTGAETPSEQASVAGCPVDRPQDIEMWINAMPGMNASPTLIAQFKVTAPTPGYRFAAKVLEIRESFPPQYVIDLVATPPEGTLIQVETETDVRFEIAELAYKEIASATVKCGGNTLFVVEPVETAY